MLSFLRRPSRQCDFHALREHCNDPDRWTRCINTATHRLKINRLRGHSCEGQHAYLYPVIDVDCFMPGKRRH